MCRIVITLCLFAVLISPVFADKNGHISITAKAELYDPPGDANIAPMFTVQARYRMSAFLAIVGSGSWTNYDYSGADVTYIPIAIDGEAHPLGRSVFDPYGGAGISFNYRQYDYDEVEDETDLTIGVELLGGVTYKPKNNFGFQFDVKYRIEDIANPGDSGSWTVGGGVTGSWEADI